MRNATSSRFLFTAALAALLVALPFLHRSVFASSRVRLPHRLPTGTLPPRLRIRPTLRSPSIIQISPRARCAPAYLAVRDSLLRFMDIASSINPATVHFRSLTEPAKLNVARAELSTICWTRTNCCRIRGARSYTGAPQNGQRHDAIRRSQSDASLPERFARLEDRERNRHGRLLREHPLS